MSVEEVLKGKTPITVSANTMVIPTSRPCKPWPAPAVQVVALSVDGSAGAGMILRDNKGTVIFASYRKLFHCNDALEAELQAMKEGLQLAVVHSQSTIVLQADCAVALKMSAEESFDRSAYG